MFANRSVAVVIPAYNEQGAIGSTLAGMPPFVDLAIVVDDGSTDGTIEEADQAANDHHVPVKIIRHSINKGVGKAISTGYAYCRTQSFDVVVVVGADGQMCPKEMPALIEPVVDGKAHYVKGNRLSHPKVRTIMPKVRQIGTRTLSLFTRWVTGLSHIGDSQCGYTAISGKTISQLDLESLYPRYGYPNDLLAKLAFGGFRVIDVPITPIYGPATSKLKVHKVILPISFLLLRSMGMRIWLGLSRLAGKPPRVKQNAEMWPQRQLSDAPSKE